MIVRISHSVNIGIEMFSILNTLHLNYFLVSQMKRMPKLPTIYEDGKCVDQIVGDVYSSCVCLKGHLLFRFQYF